MKSDRDKATAAVVEQSGTEQLCAFDQTASLLEPIASEAHSDCLVIGAVRNDAQAKRLEEHLVAERENGTIHHLRCQSPFIFLVFFIHFYAIMFSPTKKHIPLEIWHSIMRFAYN